MVKGNNPISAVWAPAIGAAAPRDLCTDCGVSRSSDPKQCGQACQFIKPDYPALEARVHGRTRDPARTDEIFFGPFRSMVRASLKPPRPGAQWTGIATRIGERLLETGAVDAVLTMAPDPNDKWRPMPVLVTAAEGMSQCRGMRMGYAPLLSLLEPAHARGFKRIAVIGIPCQVYALRALEAKLGFCRATWKIDPLTTRGIDPLATRSERGFYAATQFRSSAVQRSAEGGHAGAGRGFGDTPAQRAGVG